MKRALSLLLSFACGCAPLSAVTWTPLARVQAVGGQYFIEHNRSKFSGNVDWMFSSGLKFSDRWSVIPTVSGQYDGVRKVRELIGGGFLARETLDNTAIVKGIYGLNKNWKGKIKASYKNQALVESVSEKIGKGLFDSHKFGLGMELERSGKRFKSLRIGLDPYAVRFYHYSSQSSTSKLGSEINNGSHNLDFNAYDFIPAVEVALTPKTSLTASALYSYRTFVDQRVVQGSGVFAANNRADHFYQASLGLSRVLPVWAAAKMQSLAGVEVSYGALRSNQHNYDAAYDAVKSRFNQDYYDYTDVSVSPRLAGRLFRKLDWALNYNFTRRDYRARPAQAVNRDYTRDKIYINTHTLSYTFRYPLSFGMSVLATGAYRQAQSNMRYERTYLYNYISQHYFAGISWEH